MDNRALYRQRAWRSLFAIPATPVFYAWLKAHGDSWLREAALSNGCPVLELAGILLGIALGISFIINMIASVPPCTEERKH